MFIVHSYLYVTRKDVCIVVPFDMNKSVFFEVRLF